MMARLFRRRSPTEVARAAVRRTLSQRGTFRGAAIKDGRATLLVVNFRSDADLGRLIASWRRFVSADWPVVVVENSGSPIPQKKYGTGVRVIGLGLNLHHGLGLDLGLRFVKSEYVVICDPDSIIASGSFWSTVLSRLEAYGVASIDLGTDFYHPICLAMRTDIWKEGHFSMEQDWSRGWDVGGALTAELGLHRDALLPRTRGAGPALATQGSGQHHIAEVYGDVFSNTFGASRMAVGEDEFGEHERPILETFQELHRKWRGWADNVVAGTASVVDFDHSVTIGAAADPGDRPQGG